MPGPIPRPIKRAFLLNQLQTKSFFQSGLAKWSSYGSAADEEDGDGQTGIQASKEFYPTGIESLGGEGGHYDYFSDLIATGR